MEGGPTAESWLASVSTLGLQIENPKLAKLTRRVLLVSSLACMMVVAANLAGFFVRLGPTTGPVAVSGLVGLMAGIGLAILVPICGYLGAHRSDPSLTCFFCGCNLVGGCLNLLILALLVSFLIQLSFAGRESTLPASSGTALGHNYKHICWGLNGTDCANRLSMIKVAVLVAITIRVPTIILQCLGCWWGRQLFAALQKGEVLHRVVAGVPAMTQEMPQPPVPLFAKDKYGVWQV